MVAQKRFCPKRGDIIWIDFSAARGHEQRGRRPAIVVSPFAYNIQTGLALACPITSKTKHYTHEVVFHGLLIKGAILSDQIRTIDWKARRAEFIESASIFAIDEVEARLLTLIQD